MAQIQLKMKKHLHNSLRALFLSLVDHSFDYLKRNATVFFVIVSAILVTLFSSCSWIYPINPWDDANVFMSIGKSMKHGLLLYKDIFDQKGPCLFFIHQLSCYVSENSFLGIYFLEILCLWGYLTFSYRIMRLFTENSITIPLTIFLGTIYITSDFFWYGDSVEELCLPILSYSLFHILRFIKTSRPPQISSSLFIGIGAGVVFWMKFTLMTFYAGVLIALIFVLYRKKLLNLLVKPLLLVVAGLLLVTFFVFAYFLYHGTFLEMVDAYFYTNLFLYHGTASNGEPAGLWFKLVKLAICAILVLPAAIIKVRWDVRVVVLVPFILQMLSYALFTVHLYYFIPLFAYFPLFIFFLRRQRTTKVSYVVMLVLAVLSVITNFNIVTLISGTFPNTIKEYAKIINEDMSVCKRVLTFSSRDVGIHLLTDQLPPIKYFFIPNIIKPEIKEEQSRALATGDIKYLVRKYDDNQYVVPYYEIKVPENYELICQKQELLRHRFFLNPFMFLWNLGYTQPLLNHFMEPKREYQTIVLYRKR